MKKGVFTYIHQTAQTTNHKPQTTNHKPQTAQNIASGKEAQAFTQYRSGSSSLGLYMMVVKNCDYN
jgi:hypothetical protein